MLFVNLAYTRERRGLADVVRRGLHQLLVLLVLLLVPLGGVLLGGHLRQLRHGEAVVGGLARPLGLSARETRGIVVARLLLAALAVGGEDALDELAGGALRFRGRRRGRLLMVLSWRGVG